eukprot:3700845-Pyramimonas_sp.AAC.1
MGGGVSTEKTSSRSRTSRLEESLLASSEEDVDYPGNIPPTPTTQVVTPSTNPVRSLFAHHDAEFGSLR